MHMSAQCCPLTVFCNDSFIPFLLFIHIPPCFFRIQTVFTNCFISVVGVYYQLGSSSGGLFLTQAILNMSRTVLIVVDIWMRVYVANSCFIFIWEFHAWGTRRKIYTPNVCMCVFQTLKQHLLLKVKRNGCRGHLFTRHEATAETAVHTHTCGGVCMVPQGVMKTKCCFNQTP